MYSIKSVIALEDFRKVIHNYAASFSIKTCLDKLTTFFNSKTKTICLNLLIVCESELKIKVTSPREIF